MGLSRQLGVCVQCHGARDAATLSLALQALGLHIRGFAPSLDVMLRYRASLAPLRYGAGLKGKVVDSWWHGLPVVTTPIGAEGMQQPGGSDAAQAAEWGGLCTATSAEQLAADTVRLVSDETLWRASQRRGFSLLAQLYDRQANLGRVCAAVEEALAEQEQRRGQDFVGGMLWQQGQRATEYFSRWIELKETTRERGAASGAPS